MAESKTSPRRLESKARQAKAVALRRGGATFEEIARTLGYAHKGKAYEAVHKALREVHLEDSEAIVALELERLDTLHASLWPLALAGDYQAVDRVLKIMERRAKFLGLDYNEARMADAAEREATQAERDGAELAGAIRRILVRLNLTAEQETLVGTVVPSELRALAGGEGP